MDFKIVEYNNRIIFCYYSGWYGVYDNNLREHKFDTLQGAKDFINLIHKQNETKIAFDY